MPDLSFDNEAAVTRLVRFLAVQGITGQEAAIGREVVQALHEIGVPEGNIRFDKAHEKIPLPTQTGNLIVQLPGSGSGPRRLFMSHMDTVPLGAGAVPGCSAGGGGSSRRVKRRWGAIIGPGWRAW